MFSDQSLKLLKYTLGGFSGSVLACGTSVSVFFIISSAFLCQINAGKKPFLLNFIFLCNKTRRSAVFIFELRGSRT
ncbi:MAG: hypothetical protein D4R45_03990 [Planctomycetaceae bacterium]|nr:MAG: hypothetical protein D4R45_03990 [Planctomycetaceae bacterium]